MNWVVANPKSEIEGINRFDAVENGCVAISWCVCVRVDAAGVHGDDDDDGSIVSLCSIEERGAFAEPRSRRRTRSNPFHPRLFGKGARVSGLPLYLLSHNRSIDNNGLDLASIDVVQNVPCSSPIPHRVSVIDWVAAVQPNVSNVQLLFDRVFITIVYTTQKHIMILFPFIGRDINHIIGENYAKQRLHKFPETMRPKEIILEWMHGIERLAIASLAPEARLHLVRGRLNGVWLVEGRVFMRCKERPELRRCSFYVSLFLWKFEYERIIYLWRMT